jgi:hypothetical protein
VWTKLARHAVRLALTPLNEEHTHSLMAALFGEVPNRAHLAAWMYRQTAGNPARCLDLAHLLLVRGSVSYTGGTFTLPFEFDDGLVHHAPVEALLSGLAGAAASAQEVAHLLALEPGPLTVAQLANASGLSEKDVLLGLEALVDRGAAVSQHDRFACASESWRSALAHLISEPEARRRHLRLAGAIAARKDGSLETALATARHLLAAGADHALEGAELLARTGDEHKFELAMMRDALPLLEAALQVMQRHGVPEHDCVGLLVPLSFSGFFGDMRSQNRYLDRTLSALASLCGLTRARACALARAAARPVGGHDRGRARPPLPEAAAQSPLVPAASRGSGSHHRPGHRRRGERLRCRGDAPHRQLHRPIGGGAEEQSHLRHAGVRLGHRRTGRAQAASVVGTLRKGARHLREARVWH